MKISFRLFSYQSLLFFSAVYSIGLILPFRTPRVNEFPAAFCTNVSQNRHIEKKSYCFLPVSYRKAAFFLFIACGKYVKMTLNTVKAAK